MPNSIAVALLWATALATDGNGEKIEDDLISEQTREFHRLGQVLFSGELGKHLVWGARDEVWQQSKHEWGLKVVHFCHF